MNPRVARVVDLGRAIVHETRTEKITFLAGSLAYHAFISLLPLLVLVLVAITTLGNSTLQRGYEEFVTALLSPGGGEGTAAQLFLEELQKTGESTGLSIVGGAVLLWGTMRIFRGLDTAFSDVYETEAENTFVDQLSDGAIVLVAFAAAIVVAGALQRLVPDGSVGVGWRGLKFVLLFGGLTLTLYPMYFVFPDADVSPVEVLPGTVFAALGLASLETLFRVYLKLSGSSGDSDLIAGILVLLTWLYVTSLVVLEGVVINAVLSNRSADVDVRPVFGGITPTRTEGRTSIDREVLVNRLTHLDSLLDDADSMTISVGDESLTFPAPRTHEADTEERLFELGGGRLGLTLKWSAGASSHDSANSDDGETTAETAARGTMTEDETGSATMGNATGVDATTRDTTTRDPTTRDATREDETTSSGDG